MMMRSMSECGELEHEDSFAAELLGSLSAYIRKPGFKRLFNQIVTEQANTGFESLCVISQFSGEGKSFLVSALALAYTKFLQSRVLIVETIQQTTARSLYLESVLGEHLPELSALHGGSEPGYIDLLTTSGSEEGTFDTADFHIGEYIANVKSRYDVVLVDTCALGDSDENNLDPFIVARHSDRALLLFSPISAGLVEIQESKKELERCGVSLLGAVYNRSVAPRRRQANAFKRLAA
ncbi:MAG: hypothetical protein KDD64_05155 [Bdellovibrionales bacterium]|nr:hypothetical protein [Bdellovibrionales bacterium]